MSNQLNLIEFPPEVPLLLKKAEIYKRRRLFGTKVFVWLAVQYDLQHELIKPGEDAFSESKISEFIDRWNIEKGFREIRNLLVQLSDSGYLPCSVDVQLTFENEEEDLPARDHLLAKIDAVLERAS